MPRPVYRVKRCDCDCADHVSPCECGGDGGCYLTLPPPIGASPYADETEAAAIIAAQTDQCHGFVERATGASLTSFVVNIATANQTGITVVGNPDGAPTAQAAVWCGFVAPAGTTFSLVTSTGGTNMGNSMELYDSSGSLVDFAFSPGFPISGTAPTAGQYFLRMVSTSDVSFADDTFQFTVTADDDVTRCGIRAAHGGTPDYLVCTP